MYRSGSFIRHQIAPCFGSVRKHYVIDTVPFTYRNLKLPDCVQKKTRRVPQPSETTEEELMLTLGPLVTDF